MKLQRLGGYAGIGSIGAYLAFLLLVTVVLSRKGLDLRDPVKMLAALSTDLAAYSYVALLLLMVSYFLFLIMAFALQERMQANAPLLTRFILMAASIAAAMQIAGTSVWSEVSDRSFRRKIFRLTGRSHQ